MAEPIEGLIERLVAEAEPVQRLPPPALRAAMWLFVAGAAMALAVVLFADLAVFRERASDPKLMLELIGTLVTGILAVLAAFELSLPDRSSRWALLPLPPLALWIASSGYSCYRQWITYGPNGWGLGESAHCFRFILGASLPLGVALLLTLRRAAPLAPVSVAAMGGLGSAALAAFILQFFHPFDVTIMDLAVHLGSVGLVVAVAAAWERRASRNAGIVH